VIIISIWVKKKWIKEPFIFDDVITKLACINGVEDINEWLQPSKKSVHSPYLLDNIKEVALKIIKAIEQNKNICISYDVDGKI
jgi:single-stranded-DNA-specific exonuclease